MDIERLLIYGLAGVLIVVALVRRSNSLKAGRIKGPVSVGDNSGTLIQTYSDAAVSPRSNDEARPASAGDRIAWVIAIVGVLVAAAQFAHDVFFK